LYFQFYADSKLFVNTQHDFSPAKGDETGDAVGVIVELRL